MKYLFLILVFFTFFVSSVSAADPISIDYSQPPTVLQYSPGVTHTQYSLDPWGNPTAIASGKQILSTSVNWQNQHIMGWGADNPWPDRNTTDPTQWNWSSLDRRVQLIRDTGSTPVITLCCAPTWMIDESKNGQTDWNLLEKAPLPNHFADYAKLAAAVARRYPDIRYFQVWNELKGFYNATLNRWDYEGYTQLYNRVYTALKQVDPQLQIGGPYVVVDTWGNRSTMSHPSSVTGPYGTLDQRALDTIMYWLKNAAGADFIVLDASSSPRDHVWTGDEFSTSQIFTDTANWVRNLDPTTYPQARTLPIWWAEWYIGMPNDSTDTSYLAAVIGAGLIKTLKNNAGQPFLWKPQGDATGLSSKLGLWTDTQIAGGGQPTPLHPVFKIIHDNFPPGTAIYPVTTSLTDISVLASRTHVLLINHRNSTRTVSLTPKSFTLNPYEAKLVSTPNSSIKQILADYYSTATQSDINADQLVNSVDFAIGIN